MTIATIMYVGFPRPETRFTLVVTLLLVYAPLTLVPVVLLSRVTHILPIRSFFSSALHLIEIKPEEIGTETHALRDQEL